MANGIHFSERYLENLTAAIDNSWLVSKDAAQRFAEEHDREVALLAEFPGIGKALAAGRQSFPIGKTGYRIIYRAKSGQLLLIRLENVRRARR